MRATTALAQLALCLGTLTSVAAGNWLQDMHLLARQDNNGDNGGDSTDTTAEATPTDEAAQPEDSDQAAQPDDTATRRLNTAKTLDPDAPRPTKTGSKGNSTDKEEFDFTEPVAGIVMITPDRFLGQPLYKAGNTVTLVWNYTNLLGTPTAVDVMLTCSENLAAYTLSANMSFNEVQSYTWDTQEQATDATQPLINSEYTLVVNDSDRELTATPEPGYLSTDKSFRMKIYIPKDYTPLSEWNCATCSAALDGMEARALAFAVSMSLITVASFTWFVSGLSL